MAEPDSTARRHCEQCRRPASHCLCPNITVTENRTRVLVLQHPDEHKHPLNTARLAVLGLRRAELLVGEFFPQLDMILSVSGPAALLFPGESSQSPLSPAGNGAAAPALLIVPDGTWRKARKIVHANPILNTLPRLSLPAGENSRYRVRKTTMPGAVSTIEAIERTLAILEPEQDFRLMLKPFDVLIEQQITAMGPDLYRRHHLLQVRPETDC